MNKKTLENIEKLFNALKENESLSIEDMQHILNCNRQSINNYLNRLKKNGVTFTQYSKNRKTYYSIDKQCDNINYKPITNDVIRKYIIASKLQSTAIYAKQFSRNFSNAIALEDDMENEKAILLDVGHTKYYELINEMKDNCDIYYYENKYYLTGNSIPLLLPLDDNNNILKYLNTILANNTKGSPYYEVLNSLYQKTNILLGNIPDDNSFSKNCIIYGKNYEGLSSITDRLKPFHKQDYKNFILNITYEPKNKELINVLFATGLLIYNVEKDKFYIIGQEVRENDNKDSKEYESPQYKTIIEISTIKEIKTTTLKNHFYNNSTYSKIFEYMFSISIEEPCKVAVEFDDFGNVTNKFKYLKERRFKTASICESDCNNEDILQADTKKYIYRDTVGGLSDFATYLRKFGKSVKVLEPQELRDKMNYSIEETLNRYEIKED